jgi:hypothetical protein
VKVALFRPFDAGRWLTIGFCAWLAMLGQGGGGGGGGGGNYGGGGRHHGGHELRHGLRQAWEWIQDNLYWLLPVVVGLVLIGLLIWALITWLSSRGQFMFLHCVATNRAEIRVPWRNYARQANSLFWFRLGLGLISFVIIVPAVIAAIVMILTMVANEAVHAPLLLGTLGAIGAAVLFGILFALIEKFTLDFVVPIMALRTRSWRQAWGEFSGVLSAHKFSFLVYILFQIVLAIVVGIGIFALVIMTCCIAGCLLAIPFVGTLLLLPVLVFDRAYSLYYLEQFGDAYRLLTPNP